LSSATDRPRHQHLRGLQARLLISSTVLGELLRYAVQVIPSNALWIAVSCLEHGALLFSLDAHFERVPGLRLVRSWAEVV
jgi:predicted nucleic acid-binding protein